MSKGSKQTNTPGRIDAVPPWCYWRPGMSPEAAALDAAKALEITHPLDLLNLLWALRRHARHTEMDTRK